MVVKEFFFFRITVVIREASKDREADQLIRNVDTDCSSGHSSIVDAFEVPRTFAKEACKHSKIFQARMLPPLMIF